MIGKLHLLNLFEDKSAHSSRSTLRLHNWKMMRYRQLGATGLKLSVIAMGGSGFGNVYGKFDEGEAIQAVRYAMDKGINYFDTAYWYGQGTSESFLGKALYGIERDKFYIGTKVGRYERDIPNMFNFSAEKVTQTAEESLKRLKLEYVDILQVHDVEFAPSVDMIVNETIPAMQKMKERGLCKFIGITGYPLNVLRAVVDCSPIKIDSVLSYCRLTMNDSSLASDLDFYKSKGIPLINASPVSMGLLTEAGVQPWHPAGKEIQKACSEAVQYCVNHGVDIVRLAVNYSVDFEQATTTLVSMVESGIVDKNIDAVCRPLTEEELEVREYIMKHYFEPIEPKHWEDKEVQDHWQEMNKHK